MKFSHSKDRGDASFSFANFVLTSTIPGSGLDLWITNAFVTANGGKLDAESSWTRLGATDRISLPAVDDGIRRASVTAASSCADIRQGYDRYVARLPGDNKKHERDGDRRKSEVKPGTISVRVFRAVKELRGKKDAGDNAQCQANEVERRVVGRPNCLVLRHGDTQRHRDQ